MFKTWVYLPINAPSAVASAYKSLKISALERILAVLPTLPSAFTLASKSERINKYETVPPVLLPPAET